jgi:hypothetical protein
LSIGRSPGSQTGQFQPSYGFDLGRAGGLRVSSDCSAIRAPSTFFSALLPFLKIWHFMPKQPMLRLLFATIHGSIPGAAATRERRPARPLFIHYGWPVLREQSLIAPWPALLFLRCCGPSGAHISGHRTKSVPPSLAPSSSVSQPFGSTHRDCMTDPSFKAIDAHIRSSRTQHAQSMPHPSDVSHFCVHNQVHKTWLESLSRETRSRTRGLCALSTVWFQRCPQTTERQRPAMSGACPVNSGNWPRFVVPPAK